MKAAPLLRAWLKRLVESGVKFYYRHQRLSLKEHSLEIKSCLVIKCTARAMMRLSWVVEQCHGLNSVVMAHGKTGLEADEIEPFQASNAGVEHEWSTHMQPVFGQPLKRIAAWVGDAEKVWAISSSPIMA